MIAGGPCACNPEPLASFIDVFLLGDGEESITQIMDMYCAWQESGRSREDFLLTCAKTPGMYVPAFYAPAKKFGAPAPLRPDVPTKIEKT